MNIAEVGQNVFSQWNKLAMATILVMQLPATRANNYWALCESNQRVHAPALSQLNFPNSIVALKLRCLRGDIQVEDDVYCSIGSWFWAVKSLLELVSVRKRLASWSQTRSSSDLATL